MDKKELPLYDGPDGLWRKLQNSGRCWYCSEKKVNPYGLCTKCLRFGKMDNQFSDRKY